MPAALAAVRSRWPALLDALRGSAPATRLRALLSDASPLAVEDDLLTIGFRFAMLSEKAQEPLHRAELEKALSNVYGRNYRLNFRVTPDLAPPGPVTNVAPRSGPPGVAAATVTAIDGPDPGPGGEAAAAVRGTSAPGDTISGEQLVDAAVEMLGARVTDIRSRPRPA